jgi:hypothetical protein
MCSIEPRPVVIGITQGLAQAMVTPVLDKHRKHTNDQRYTRSKRPVKQRRRRA